MRQNLSFTRVTLVLFEYFSAFSESTFQKTAKKNLKHFLSRNFSTKMVFQFDYLLLLSNKANPLFFQLLSHHAEKKRQKFEKKIALVLVF